MPFVSKHLCDDKQHACYEHQEFQCLLPLKRNVRLEMKSCAKLITLFIGDQFISFHFIFGDEKL